MVYCTNDRETWHSSENTKKMDNKRNNEIIETVIA